MRLTIMMAWLVGSAPTEALHAQSTPIGFAHDSAAVAASMRDALSRLNAGARLRLTDAGMQTRQEYRLASLSGDSLWVHEGKGGTSVQSGPELRRLALSDTLEAFEGRKRYGVRRGAVRGFAAGAIGGGLLVYLANSKEQTLVGGPEVIAASAAVLYGVSGMIAGGVLGLMKVDKWQIVWPRPPMER